MLFLSRIAMAAAPLAVALFTGTAHVAPAKPAECCCKVCTCATCTCGSSCASCCGSCSGCCCK